jgi:hypothetical protein
MKIRFIFYVLILSVLARNAVAQQRGAAPQGATPAAPQPPPTPRASAQVDITGNWVPLITEDWRWRMVTPPKGNYASVPLNDAGKKLADTWDLAKDEAAGEQCKPYGAAAIMRMPVRVQISWADDTTLKIETDGGQQTRLFNFDKAKQATGPRTWQGFSAAEWTRPPAGRGRGGEVPPTPMGGLKVVTRNLRAGYLRKNGVPYSENAVVTEYYDTASAFGVQYLNVTTIVEDPTYLTMPFVTSSNFKKEADGSKWNPGPCKTEPPIASKWPLQ